LTKPTVWSVNFVPGVSARGKGSVSMVYVMYKDAKGEWRWRLWAANRSDVLADSGEGYKNKADCLHAINLVKNSKDAPVQIKE